ncbi:hypothetical protein RJ641_008455 [Dillenia turbinata]|uniref:Uncharacterized protein n=1 Tax=Dillenia turbinata TaxID=194707 RepID=A0AAN8VAY0_9MAGN
MAARNLSSKTKVPVTVKPHVSTSKDYEALRPQQSHKRQFFRGREVKNCMPKGFWHSSAPSRYLVVLLAGMAENIEVGLQVDSEGTACTSDKAGVLKNLSPPFYTGISI